MKYRQSLDVPNYPKTWGRLADAVAVSGLNKNIIYELIKNGLIESYLHTTRPDSRGGCRMINLESLNRYIAKRSREARAAEAKEVAK